MVTPSPGPLRGAGTLRRLRYTGALRGRGDDLDNLESLRKLRSSAWRPDLVSLPVVGVQAGEDAAARGGRQGVHDPHDAVLAAAHGVAVRQARRGLELRHDAADVLGRAVVMAGGG